MNEFDLRVLKRKESKTKNPSDGLKISLSNQLIDTINYNNLFIYNKILMNNSFNDYYFNNSRNLNHKSFKSNLTVSSDFDFKKYGFSKPRIKFIVPLTLANSDKRINEDSESITFNYENQFSENRFFGNDLFDSSPRIVFGIENYIYFQNKKIELNFNQSFETNKNNTYASKLNQSSNFSDIAFEASLDTKNILFKLDSRHDQENFSKKEMNYSVSFNDPLNLFLNYNETDSEAFSSLSNDTQSIDLGISKNINKNLSLGYYSSLDVKNNYNPYKGSLKLSLFDECSKLEIEYSNTRFNDNFNTKPEETIGLTFSMDYLGFFGYEQKTDLFSDEKK